ncbi:kinase [Thraustotheca clavata]|uniref:Kinase n=1 Tax=Thraustotheca clavata TaxID=74557 RepID=A0A1V9YZX1_9STRA|nr:kinase [Thraustotheca clavata]
MLDMTQANAKFPDTMASLKFMNSSLNTTPMNFKWPSQLHTLILQNNNLYYIPNALPSTLREMRWNLNNLRQHRLETEDLKVCGTKPIAHGDKCHIWSRIYGEQEVAIKRLKNRSYLPRYIKLLAGLDSPYIVQFIAVSWTMPTDLVIVMKFMHTDLQKANAIHNILRGLLNLHSHNPVIAHGNLKSSNVLIDPTKGAKLTCFGDYYENDTIVSIFWQWKAPKDLRGEKSLIDADIYAFGVLLFEFCSHKLPFCDIIDLNTNRPLNQRKIISGICIGRNQPSFGGPNVPTWVKEIDLHCVQFNPYDRPSADQLLAINLKSLLGLIGVKFIMYWTFALDLILYKRYSPSPIHCCILKKFKPSSEL